MQQPLSEDTTFMEFMKKHGNGVHHIGFEAGKDRDAVIEHLADMGFDTDRPEADPEHTMPRRGVAPLDTARYILAARSALEGEIC